ncbi:hypothetical protein [Curtobacterium pusillum]|uniref:hypothetical protein n=1 Tax=Curtobacterium pusillum TaxID=69373 RepID=UPI00119CB86E|nr:hypothetical protein [Curtobacterium pusillum]
MTAAELRTMLARGVEPVPREVLHAIDRLVAVDASVDVVAMPAASLAKMIDKTYARSTEGLARVADEVRAFDGELVRLCRAEANGNVLLVVLAATTPTVVSAFVHDRGEPQSTLERAQLEQLLHRSNVPNRSVAEDALQDLSPEAEFALHRQDATRTARTFEQKYSAAIRSGVDVRGLDAFVLALRDQNGEAVLLLDLPAPDGALIIGVREDRSEILAVLHIRGFPT